MRSLRETVLALVATLLALLILSFLCFGTMRMLVRWVDASPLEAAASVLGACILALLMGGASLLRK